MSHLPYQNAAGAMLNGWCWLNGPAQALTASLASILRIRTLARHNLSATRPIRSSKHPGNLYSCPLRWAFQFRQQISSQRPLTDPKATSKSFKKQYARRASDEHVLHGERAALLQQIMVLQVHGMAHDL